MLPQQHVHCCWARVLSQWSRASLPACNQPRMIICTSEIRSFPNEASDALKGFCMWGPASLCHALAIKNHRASRRAMPQTKAGKEAKPLCDSRTVCSLPQDRGDLLITLQSKRLKRNTFQLCNHQEILPRASTFSPRRYGD